MKPSSVFVLVAGLMFIAAFIATGAEKDTPGALSIAYFGLGFANVAFSQL